MLEHPKLKELAERKRLLVARSELNRLTIQVECERHKVASAWVDLGFRFVQAIKPVIPLTLPVAAVLLTKRGGFIGRLGVAAFLRWRQLKVLRGIWQGIRSK